MFRSATLVLLTGLAPVAVAATVTVAPNGPITSIQGGVDAAAAGDTVLVKTGTYVETVSISGKAGIVLKAKGKVTLDARPGGTAGSGAAIVIASSDTVVVEGFTIRHAKSDGMGNLGRGVIATGSLGVTVRKCTFVACEDFAVQITGVSARVDSCKVVGGGGGVNVIGNGFSVTKTTVRDVEDDGVRVNGLLGLVQSCSIAGTSIGQGIHLTGQGCVIEKCQITRTEAEAILLSNDDNLIQKNVIRDINDEGIHSLSANGTQVLSNTISGTANEAIALDGDDVVVRKNKLSDFGAAGIAVEGGNFAIEQNTLVGAGINSLGITVSTAPGRREPHFSPVSKPPGSSPLHRRIGPRLGTTAGPGPGLSSRSTDAAIRGQGDRRGTDRGRRRLRPRHRRRVPMPSTEAMERRRREPPFSPVSKPPGSSPLRRRIGPRTRHDSRPWPPASRSFRTDAAIR
jgi:hypothetical protein